MYWGSWRLLSEADTQKESSVLGQCFDFVCRDVWQHVAACKINKVFEPNDAAGEGPGAFLSDAPPSPPTIEIEIIEISATRPHSHF